MSASSYDDALARLLAHEGGYSNHSADPGGPTNFGITIHDYRRYVKPDATAADVKAMKVEEAKIIYRAKYWDAMRCDELPAGVDYAVFDYGVNSGIARARKVLQRVVGVTDDGVLGPRTMQAVRAHAPAVIVRAICDERLAFLQSLGTWPVFGKGWGRRVAEVKAAALQMAGGQRVPAPPATLVLAPGRGVVPMEKGAQQASTGAVAAAGAAAAQQAHAAGARPAIVAAILLASLAAAVGAWAFWHWRQTRRQEA